MRYFDISLTMFHLKYEMLSIHGLVMLRFFIPFPHLLQLIWKQNMPEILVKNIAF